MKSPLHEPLARCLPAAILTLGFAFFTQPASAQVATTDSSKLAGATKQAYEDSQALAEFKDFAGAEQLLADTCRSKAGTAGWQVEIANRLTRLAFHCANQGNSAAVDALARSALVHLGQVTDTADPAVIANALELSGLIYERLVGDITTARQRYGAALQYLPGSVAATEALTRLNSSEFQAAQKQGRGPGG